jgi:hypothetical protein
MARRTPRSRAAAAPARKPKAKSKKPALAAGMEVVEDSGEGLDTAVILATTFALVFAIVFTDALLGKFEAGVFF